MVSYKRRENEMDSIIFNIYFILAYASIWVFTYDNRQWTLLSFTNENRAFQIAGCIAHCKQNQHCQEECRNVKGLSPTRTEQENDNNTLFFEDSNGTEPANFNASLHCKDIDVIKLKHNPGIWVIEQRSSLRNDSVVWDKTERDVGDDKIVKYIRVINAESGSSATISVFTNLSAGTFYRYKAHRVRVNDLGGIVLSEAEISPWFKTFELGHRSEEVKSLHLAGTRLDEINPWRVRADIYIEPGSDRSCNYEVISFNEEQGLTIGNVDSSSQDFRFSLHDLDYMRNVSVFVSSRNRGTLGSSGNASLVFATPSCVELHRDVAFCAPERVRGLRADKLSLRENGSNYEILVEWDPPVFPPDNYTLQVQSGLDYYDGSGEPSLSPPLRSILLPGNTTKTLLKLKVHNVGEPEVTGDNERRPRTIILISIMAESPGGKSLESWINVTLDDILETILDGTPVGPVAITEREGTRPRILDGFINALPPALLTIFATLILLGIVYYARRGTDKYRQRQTVINGESRRAKYKGDKSYRYCQNLTDAGGKKTRRDSPFNVMGKIAKFTGDFEKMDPLLLPVTTPIKDKFEIHPSQLTIKGILGSGASGIVRLGTLHPDSSNNRHSSMNVAIKMLKDNPNTEDLKNFQQEISIMKSAGQHPNIVSIIGCCTLQILRPMLVVEYCSRGDLQTYLRAIWQETMSTNTFEHKIRRIIGIQNEKTIGIPSAMIKKMNNVEDTTYRKAARQFAITNQLYDIQEAASVSSDRVTVADLLNYARQVASGMEFLASNRIIHRDLAARNVLVCADKTVKISDFGLSRDIYQENVYKKQGNGRLPLKWMAIEALTHQIYTTQSDVWSFGILLWEIVTLGCNPYPDTPTNMVLQYLKSGYRMEKPDNCGNELYNIMMSCWQSRPRRRPNFTQLKHQLDRLLRTVSDNEYLNLYDVHPREPSSSGSGSNSSITNRQDPLKQLVDKPNEYSNVFST